MAVLDPANTTMGDLVNEALKLSGRVGLGQTALAEDAQLGWTYLQWMFQEWERKRWNVYRIVSLNFLSTGAQTYTIGPVGNFNTGTTANSVRPAKIESAFIRQQDVGDDLPDFPIQILATRQEYDRISLKTLSSLPYYLWYDPAWPLGVLYFWPVPPASSYALYVSVLEQLPVKFLTQAVVISLPYEYYWAIVTNLAMRLRGRYGIKTYPGDTLPGNAKESLQTLSKSNVAIPRLEMPGDLPGSRGGGYDIFTDNC